MKCLIYTNSPDYFVFLDSKELEILEQKEILKGNFYREFAGGFYQTLGRIYIIVKEDIQNWSYVKDKNLTLHTIPKMFLEYLKKSPKGYNEYRYNFNGDKLCVFLTDKNDCMLVKHFTDPEFQLTYNKLKSLKLIGLPEYNY